ncbi:MAG: hypothetical protein WDN28_12005 [Chthoniobacter sp.]
MKSFLLPLTILALSLAPLRAADEPRLAALQAADDERVAATVAADGAKLKVILSDDLRYAHASGSGGHQDLLPRRHRRRPPQIRHL